MQGYVVQRFLIISRAVRRPSIRPSINERRSYEHWTLWLQHHFGLLEFRQYCMHFAELLQLWFVDETDCTLTMNSPLEANKG